MKFEEPINVTTGLTTLGGVIQIPDISFGRMGGGTFSVISPSVEGVISGYMSPFFHFDGIFHSRSIDVLEKSSCEYHISVR